MHSVCLAVAGSVSFGRDMHRRLSHPFDLQTIVGGTGKLSGAQGFVRASGTFSTINGGISEYVGSVCLR